MSRTLLRYIIALFACSYRYPLNGFNYKCKYLSNGCRFLNDTFENRELKNLIVCHELIQSNRFDLTELNGCLTDWVVDSIFDAQIGPKVLDRGSFNPVVLQLFSRTTFVNLAGFDSNSSFELLVDSTTDSENVRIVFFSIKLEFYLNNRLVSSCQELKNSNLIEPRSLFQLETTQQIWIEIKYTSFNSEPLCPRFFENVQIFKLNIYHMTDTFFKHNRLKFQIQNQNFEEQEYNRRTHIEILVFTRVEKITLASDLLHPHIFHRLEQLIVTGEISAIHSNVFRPLIHLRSIHFDIVFFGNLIRKGTEWLQSINQGLHVNLSNITELSLNADRITILSVSEISLAKYEATLVENLLSNEEFCLFARFPFDQLIALTSWQYFRFTRRPSCTVVWLGRFSKQYASQIESIRAEDYLSLIFWRDYMKLVNAKMVDACIFERRLKLCNRTRLRPTGTLNDLRDAFILIEFSLIVAFLPVASLIAIVLNSFVVYAITIKDNKKYLDAKQYAYMRVVSICHIFGAFIDLISLIYECQTFEGLYCSSIKTLQFVQYFQIIFGEFISSSIRLVANLAYLGFSISRLSLIGTEHSAFVKKVSGFSVFKFILVSAVSGLLLSAVKIIRLQPRIYGLETENWKNSFPSPFDRNYFNIETKRFEVKSRVINILNAISDLTNFLVFTLLNLILDIILVAKLKKTLDSKLNHNGAEYQNAITRAVTSVIVYASVGVIFRLPSAVKSIFDAIHFDGTLLKAVAENHVQYFYENICLRARFCAMIEKLAAVLYATSISINLIFFYLFDKRFLIGFKIALSKLFSNSSTHAEYVRALESNKRMSKAVRKVERPQTIFN